MQGTPGSGNKHFLLLSSVYIILIIAILKVRGIPYGIIHYLGWGSGVVGLCTSSALLGRAIDGLIRYRPDHPFMFLCRDFKTILKDRAPLILPIVIMYPLFIGTYMTFKGAFPLFNGYRWDPVFMRVDCFLHGSLPGETFLTSMKSPYVSFPINAIYASWFIVNGVVLSWMALTKDFRIRRRFWVSFVLCYAVLGTGMALMFLSAGPCFYDLTTQGVNPYAPQMHALHQADQQIRLNSLWLQDQFRESLHGLGVVIGGASAMPSMHIASAVLFMLTLWHHRRLRIFFIFFAIATQIACVWLGWHYAVDGYAAALGTWIIWRAVGYFRDSTEIKQAVPKEKAAPMVQRRLVNHHIGGGV